MAEQGVFFTPSEAQRTERMVRGYESQRTNRQGRTAPLPKQQFQQAREGQLTSALAAAGAGAPETDETTATFKFLVKDPDNPGDIKLTTTEYDVINRSQDLTADDEDYIIVARVNAEWRIVAVGVEFT